MLSTPEIVPLESMRQILSTEPDLNSRAVQCFQAVVTSQMVGCPVNDSLQDIVSRVTVTQTTPIPDTYYLHALVIYWYTPPPRFLGANIQYLLIDINRASS